MGSHLHDTRIPSYVVVGIGFLGAGAIVRRGSSPQGLTTAASIWMAAAVGLNMGYATSFGLYVALLATALTLIALALSDADLMSWLHVPRKLNVHVTCTASDVAVADIGKIFRDASIAVDTTEITCVRMEEGREITDIAYSVDLRRGRSLSGVIREIGALAGVLKVEATEPPFYGS
jgi:putative Mg2+ transporter-C (MgtC) family protein